MGRRVGILAAALCLPLLAVGCSTPEPQAAAKPKPPVGHLLVTATADGAVLLNRASGTYVGVARDNRRVWTDEGGAARGASVVCVATCPNAVVSGSVPPLPSEPAPVLYADTSRAPFDVSAARNRTVLAARSTTDAVVVETDAAGKAWLHLLRSGGNQRTAIATPEAGWFESPDGTSALLLPRVLSGTATVRWYARDGAGWQATDSGFDAGKLRDACVARDGRTAVLTGPQPVIVRDRTRAVPVRTDLPVVSECTLGDRGGAVLTRSFRGPVHRTDVRGIGLDGGQTWSRAYDSEAMVATDPSGERTAVAHDGMLEVHDGSGTVVRTERDVESVRFTAAGELVVVSPDGAVRWLP